MAIKGVALTVVYYAWDTANNTFKTGDVAQHTMRVVTDGTATAADNSPAELENGAYKLLVSIAEMTGNFITVEGSSSTGNIEIIPVSIVTEQGTLATLATAGALEEHHHHNWTVLFVQTGASGNADGTTWADAYTTIQAALDAASDKSTIYVGAGTYAEAITIANNKIELKTFDFDTPFNHSTGTVRITGAANTVTCTITGDEVEVIGLDFTDHATGARDGILLNGADDCKLTKITIEGVNGELRDGIRIQGNSREAAIFGCHIFGAEGSGINVTAAETHLHIEHTEIRVESGAAAGINLSGAVTESDIDDCDVFAEGTVAAGILFGASTINCAATMVRCHNFTTPYTDSGTTNSFIDVYDVVAPADAAYYTATRGPYLDRLDATVSGVPGLVWDHDIVDKEATGKSGTDAGEMLVASRAGIAGKLAISGTTVTLYEADGTTVIWTATLDSATTPTSRTAPA